MIWENSYQVFSTNIVVQKLKAPMFEMEAMIHSYIRAIRVIGIGITTKWKVPILKKKVTKIKRKKVLIGICFSPKLA